MGFKDIFKKFKSKKKIESDESYCYSHLIWNCPNNLIILLSFTEDYFEQIIELQDAINMSYLKSKIVYSSYDETVTKEEEGKMIEDIIIHKKYYLLIGGRPNYFEDIYKNINDLGNEALSMISDEITHNCRSNYFSNLCDDGILEFTTGPMYDYPKDIKKFTHYEDGTYTDPDIIMSRLPNGFTGRDVLKFIELVDSSGTNRYNALEIIKYLNMDDDEFKKHALYDLYASLINNPTIEKLKILLQPLYKQPDDDSIPGDVTDDKLDEIFREHYERFSAIMDDSMQYEDIDEELADDEESENMREGDVNNDA